MSKINEKPDRKYIRDLPQCSQRFGRIWDNIEGIRLAIMTCGHRLVEHQECVRCGGFTTPMILKTGKKA